MRVIFLGAPGSGKGTQSKLLAERNHLVYIGTGDILRAAIASETALGQRFKPYVTTGALVPDDLINALIADRLEQPDRPQQFVLDGYPRTLVQALAMDRILEQYGLAPTAAVLLHVEDEEIIRRLSGRQRADDSAETVRRRLQEFHRQTTQIAEHYRARGILHQVPGVGGVEEVYNRIKAVLNP